MKKEKQPSAAKAARKSIQESLVATLTTIATGLQKQGIHTIIDIEKEAKKIAKKITKGAKADHPETVKESPAAEAVKAPVKEKAPAKSKPAVKALVAKTEKPASAEATPAPAVVKAAPKPKAVKK